MIWWEKEGTEANKVPLAKFAKSPKRDAETGLYTVDIVIVIAIAYAEDLHEPDAGTEPAKDLGMYFVDRSVRDAIDTALGLYSNVSNGQFKKLAEQHVCAKSVAKAPTNGAKK